VGLKKALDQGLRDLNTADQGIRRYYDSIETTNRPFVERAHRVAAFVEGDPLI
jgi:hypothetical protein